MTTSTRAFSPPGNPDYEWYSTHALTEHSAATHHSAEPLVCYDPIPSPSLADLWNVNPCDFHIANLRQLNDITRIIRATVESWSFLDNFIRENDRERDCEPASYSDENAKHPPMKRRYLDMRVGVLPASARKQRTYTDEDHQVWKM